MLEEKHGVKISYVTVGRALRNPKKYWNRYFDEIEPHVWCVAEAHDKTLKDFISEPEKYQAMLETKPVYKADDAESAMVAKKEYDYAVRSSMKNGFVSMRRFWKRQDFIFIIGFLNAGIRNEGTEDEEL